MHFNYYQVGPPGHKLEDETKEGYIVIQTHVYGRSFKYNIQLFNTAVRRVEFLSMTQLLGPSCA